MKITKLLSCKTCKFSKSSTKLESLTAMLQTTIRHWHCLLLLKFFILKSLQIHRNFQRWYKEILYAIHPISPNDYILIILQYQNQYGTISKYMHPFGTLCMYSFVILICVTTIAGNTELSHHCKDFPWARLLLSYLLPSPNHS